MKLPMKLNIHDALKGAVVAAAMALGLGAGPALAEWPEKLISLYIGFNPGGQSDLLGRALATAMSEELGVPVNVINKPGAAGGVALAGLRAMPADGYSLQFNPSQTITLTPALQKVVPFSIDDFDYAGMLTSFDSALVAPASAPFDDFQGMLDYVRANPGTLYAPVSASTRFFATEIARANDLDIGILPVNGGQGVINALLGGQAMLAYSGGIHHRYPDQMKVIAALTARRNIGSPDVPTINELGIPIGMDLQTVLIAPKGLPEDVLAKLSDMLADVAGNEGFREVAASMFAPIDYRDAAQAREEMYTQLESNLAIMKAAGIEPQ
ncbi:tripartite tricarboxylate transporter substrate binding protein [Antarcticimicrobium luteum]|uniref:Tripartite tricarboxylate transporter substrate binding protein n=1 Tax=Antarcticimicrobium luteum TaxID=2547397 RepID=A0A4R5V1G9_9RHOB|nr:tripartite tricarboxylate transporter substrate binding protein [Antarcticimicrobium luteum]TDK45602.1 tripartite tricarboxylate transporter substrate binding protein [Antarcticimicrobium luteum]